jgi:hypothetical protein
MDFSSIAIGAIAGAILSIPIAPHFYRRSTNDLNSGLRGLGAAIEKKDTLEYFEFMLERGTWRPERIADRPTWICEERSVFQIVQNDDFEDFTEEWTTRVPDQHALKSTVDLKINDATVSALDFVSLDGGRYPLTTKRVVNGAALYFWERESVQFRVGKIIGRYYRFDNIEKAARFIGVEIVEKLPH